MGHTRGDEIIHSQAKPLYASADRAEVEAKMGVVQAERDRWLAANDVPGYASGSIFARYVVERTPLNDD